MLGKINMKETQNNLTVIAGHCSLNPDHLNELYDMAEIQVRDGKGGKQQALNAVRFVGLKSRTECNYDGDGMGIDFPVIKKIIETGDIAETPPSVILANKFVKDTNLGIATEVMCSNIQPKFYESLIPRQKLFLWNPSVNQLGWDIMQMSPIVSRNDWTIGIKNAKWIDMEKAWVGLSTFARCNTAFIYRGVDSPDKGEYRNLLNHDTVRNIAQLLPESRRFLDPSHSLGPNLRDKIVETTIDAMKMTVDKDNDDFLYNGILIEAGTSETDTKQHISVDELKDLVTEVSKFRRLTGPINQ